MRHAVIRNFISGCCWLPVCITPSRWKTDVIIAASENFGFQLGEPGALELNPAILRSTSKRSDAGRLSIRVHSSGEEFQTYE